jgi:hypothetical protein
MANSDINAIRAAIAEQQGRRPRRRPAKGHRPRFRVGEGRSGRPEYRRILGSALLTLAATLLATSAGQLAQYWIGDHTATHGKEWGVFRALGFQSYGFPKTWPAAFAVVLEWRLLPWLALAALLAALLTRPYMAVLLGLAAGLVPGNWPRHVPTYRLPDWVGTVLDKQESWQRSADPWFQFAVFALVALAVTAWADRTQAS